MKNFLVILIFLLISSYLQAQTPNDVKIFVRHFLSEHNPNLGGDTLNINDGIYHILQLQKIKSKRITIYEFGFNGEHIFHNYILIVDMKKDKWTIYGQNEMILDIKSITEFFNQTPRVKKSVLIQCYIYLTDNFQIGGKWIDIPIK